VPKVSRRERNYGTYVGFRRTETKKDLLASQKEAVSIEGPYANWPLLFKPTNKSTGWGAVDSQAFPLLLRSSIRSISIRWRFLTNLRDDRKVPLFIFGVGHFFNPAIEYHGYRAV
jgi:hypothetical protein